MSDSFPWLRVIASARRSRTPGPYPGSRRSSKESAFLGSCPFLFWHSPHQYIRLAMQRSSFPGLAGRSVSCAAAVRKARLPLPRPAYPTVKQAFPAAARLRGRGCAAAGDIVTCASPAARTTPPRAVWMPPTERDGPGGIQTARGGRSEEHTSELQSHLNLVCRLLLEKKKKH